MTLDGAVYWGASEANFVLAFSLSCDGPNMETNQCFVTNPIIL